MFRLRLNMARFHVSLRASVTSVAIKRHGILTRLIASLTLAMTNSRFF
ncbi:MAG: hypothetical protein K2N54_08930 [Helicobacter sp.]|nr:hypothetical protein [Helicobacter sp.]